MSLVKDTGFSSEHEFISTANEKEIEEIYDDEVDQAEFKRLVRKVDIRLIPVLILLYLASHLDRGNSECIFSIIMGGELTKTVGNARVAGMTKTLGLTPTQYNICLTVFFVPYALLEVPSNIMLKILRPQIWLPMIVLAWGTVMTLMGIVKGYSGLLAARVCFGIAEAGFFPAASYIMTLWYCRFELQTRVAAMYAASCLAGGTSGLLAFALEKMDGVGGLEGWRWIFIIEGLATVVIALALPFLLIESPEKARFFTEKEKVLYIRRLQADYPLEARGEGAQQFKWKYVWDTLTDWKIYLFVIISWGNTITGYAFIFSLPVSINQLGFTTSQAQLLTIPVYFVAMISVLVTAYYADKYKVRAPFAIYPFLACAVGFIILIALPKDKWSGARYGTLFLVGAGLFPPLCAAVAWNSNNLAPSWKRNIGVALQLTLANLGGMVGSNIYIAKEAPNYWTGYGVSLSVLVAAIVAAIVLRIYLKKENNKRDRMSLEEIHTKYTPEQLQDMGDKSPLFRYTL
jgi:MFS family permease